MRKIFTFFAAILTAYGVNAQMVLPTVESGAEPEPIATEVVDMTTTFTTAYSLADVQVAAQKALKKALKKAPARKVAVQFPAEYIRRERLHCSRSQSLLHERPAFPYRTA